MHVRFNYLTSLIPPPSRPLDGGRFQALRERELPSSFSFPSLSPFHPCSLSRSVLRDPLPSLVLSFAFLENGYLLVLFETLSFSSSTFLFSPTPNGSSFARGNSPPRIDHLPDRTLLGIISYVAVPHSRSDMRCVPRRRTRRDGSEKEREREEGGGGESGEARAGKTIRTRYTVVINVTAEGFARKCCSVKICNLARKNG